MIEEIVLLCVGLIKAAFAAGDDTEKLEAALMDAEERIAHMRAKAKFGSAP